MNYRRFVRAVGALALAGLSLSAVVIHESGCSSKVCSTSEESSCTTTYTTCITAAAMAGDMAACTKCVDDYCACYDACGNTCDRTKLSSCK